MSEEKDPRLLESVYQRFTALVIGAAIEVHRIMGPGLEIELRLRGCPVEPQVRLPMTYKGTALGDDLVMDLYFPDRLVVELKAVEKIIPVHEAQLLTYLRLSKVRVGLLINFNVPVLVNGLKRMVL